MFYTCYGTGTRLQRWKQGGVGGGDDGEMSCCGYCRNEQQLNEFDSLSG